MNNPPHHKYNIVNIESTRALFAWASFAACIISLFYPNSTFGYNLGLRTGFDSLLIDIRIGDWFSLLQVTRPLAAPVLPRKIPYQFIRWGFFFFLLLLTVLETIAILFNHDSSTLLFGTYCWLVSSILFLISSSLSLGKQDNDKKISDSIKGLISWFKTEENHPKLYTLGNKLILLAPALFILHMFFTTHFEDGFLDSKGSFDLGYETTLLTFEFIVLIPMLVLSQLATRNLYEIVQMSLLWILATISGIGNILLMTVYLFRSKIKIKSFRKKYIAVITICTIAAFFSFDLATFYFGYRLWLTAFITLLTGLLLINKYEPSENK